MKVRIEGAVVVVTLSRSAKRNALNDATIRGIDHFFSSIPQEIRCVVLDAQGKHFCAGLDLTEMAERDTFAGIEHSQMWHRAFQAIEGGRVPVISVLKGAVVGGGLELAAATHIRVAERSTFYALPEGQRGLFVGGGGSVRIPRLIGASRMMDMMLTGRRCTSEEGYAWGLSQYLVDEGAGLQTAMSMAERVARNAQQSNFGVLQVLPRIAESNPREGLLMESLMAAIAQGSEDAKRRMGEFVAGRASRVTDD